MSAENRHSYQSGCGKGREARLATNTRRYFILGTGPFWQARLQWQAWVGRPQMSESTRSREARALGGAGGREGKRSSRPHGAWCRALRAQQHLNVWQAGFTDREPWPSSSCLVSCPGRRLLELVSARPARPASSCSPSLLPRHCSCLATPDGAPSRTESRKDPTTACAHGD